METSSKNNAQSLSQPRKAGGRQSPCGLSLADQLFGQREVGVGQLRGFQRGGVGGASPSSQLRHGHMSEGGNSWSLSWGVACVPLETPFLP